MGKKKNINLIRDPYKTFNAIIQCVEDAQYYLRGFLEDADYVLHNRHLKTLKDVNSVLNKAVLISYKNLEKFEK